MPRRVFAALLVALAGALLAPAAEACDCGATGPPCIAFPKTPVLFAGRVTQVSELSIPDKTEKNDFVYRYQLVRFEVEENFRGQPRTSIEVTTGEGGGDCGFHFRTGERYLVYAGELPETGRLYTSICTRTRLLSEAAADLDFLRKRGDPGRGAGLEGTILEIGRDPKTNATPTRGNDEGCSRGRRGRWQEVGGDDRRRGLVPRLGTAGRRIQRAGRPPQELRAGREESTGHPGHVRLGAHAGDAVRVSRSEEITERTETPEVFTRRNGETE